MKKKIIILGTRGIPASYSGFETSVEETARRFVKHGYEVTVSCRANHYKDRPRLFNGVKLLYTPSIKSKHFDTVSSTITTLRYVAKNKYDIIIIYGVGNAYIIPLLNLFSKKVISVVDGADWKRAKWGAFAKAVLLGGRWFAVRFSTNYVVDNMLLCNDYKKQYKKSPVYIPYGASYSGNISDDYLKKYGLMKRSYIIFVGRFVREKGIEFLINAFKKVENNGIKLVVVGGNVTDKAYVESLLALGNENILFTGFVYGEEYQCLLKNALFYVSCSNLEGTSPSLLSAMAINGYALVGDLPENVEVLKGTCRTYFSNSENSFISTIEELLHAPDELEKMRNTTIALVNKYYSWENITKSYIKLFN